MGAKNRGVPAVIRFEARLVAGKSAAKTARLLLDVPSRIAAKLEGMVTVEGIINGHPFRAPFSSTNESHFIRVNDAMLKGARARAGDTVQLAVLGPEPEPKIPADLKAAFATSRDAVTLWKDLTLLARLDWIRWIDNTKSPETRARRIGRTIDQLAEGKRRPCCVNFYEYMLKRVAE
jgi:hypothetical protein